MALFQSFKRLAPLGGPAEPKVAHRRIPLNKLLLGDESNWRAKCYAYATGELIRPSVIDLLPSAGTSAAGEESDYYELDEGNHRAALAVVKGMNRIDTRHSFSIFQTTHP
jgi:hypothetical protein